jgi:hypothetical protein
MKNTYDSMQRTPQLLVYPGLIVPDRYYTHLSYSFIPYVILSAQSSNNLLVAFNSAYDPDKSGVGGQPAGFDELAFLYDRYRVHSSRIEVALAYSTSPMSIVVVPTTAATLPTTVAAAMDNPRCNYMIISSSNYKSQMFSELSVKELYGIQSINQDDLFQALVTADPGRLAYWRIMAVAWDGATSTTTTITVRVTYDIEFFDRRELAQS